MRDKPTGALRKPDSPKACSAQVDIQSIGPARRRGGRQTGNESFWRERKHSQPSELPRTSGQEGGGEPSGPSIERASRLSQLFLCSPAPFFCLVVGASADSGLSRLERDG